MTRSYFRGTTVLILVYDITKYVCAPEPHSKEHDIMRSAQARLLRAPLVLAGRGHARYRARSDSHGDWVSRNRLCRSCVRADGGARSGTSVTLRMERPPRAPVQ